MLEKPMLIDYMKPENYKKYTLIKRDKFIIYPYYHNNTIIEEDAFKSQYPSVYNYLLKNKTILENRKDSRVTIKEKGIPWYSIMRRVAPTNIKREMIELYTN